VAQPRSGHCLPVVLPARGSVQLLPFSPDSLRRPLRPAPSPAPAIRLSDDLAPFISLSFGCKLSPSPLLLEGGPTRKGRVPCFGVWIIEFIIQLNEELFERMAEGHAGPSNDAGRRAPRCE